MEALDRFEESTVVAALVHYALHVARPEVPVQILNKISPSTTEKAWDEIIAEAREERFATMREP